jgi:multiple RNA-binding domain-containing protein 1
VLKNHGNKKVKRSNNVMIAKNLPFSTTESEIRKLFGKFGSIRRVILPPSRSICIIEFVDTNSAKAAFKSLAYTRFHHVPLYLEWTPVSLLTDKQLPTNNDDHDDSDEKDGANDNDQTDADVNSKIAKFMNTLDGENEDSNTSTLFVKNLNFRTTEDNFLDHFASVVGNSSIRSVKIARKSSSTSSSSSNSSSSLGYGFIEFINRTIATKAIKSLQVCNFVCCIMIPLVVVNNISLFKGKRA